MGKTPVGIFEGGCLCGACRYRCSGQAINIRVCHCHRCQKTTGSAFYARVMVQRRDVEISGPVQWFDAGTKVHRGFCRNCGSTLFSHRPATDTVGLTLGTLDHPSRFAPTEHIWTASKQPWVQLADGLPQYEEDPPA